MSQFVASSPIRRFTDQVKRARPTQPNLTVTAHQTPGRRDLSRLPKAHLHLHFTGAMRPQTLIDLADEQGVRLPSHLLSIDPVKVPADASSVKL